MSDDLRMALLRVAEHARTTGTAPYITRRLRAYAASVIHPSSAADPELIAAAEAVLAAARKAGQDA